MTELTRVDHALTAVNFHQNFSKRVITLEIHLKCYKSDPIVQIHCKIYFGTNGIDEFLKKIDHYDENTLSDPFKA